MDPAQAIGVNSFRQEEGMGFIR